MKANKKSWIKHMSLMVLSFCLLGGTYAGKPKESEKPVKVFLLAGQSNMEGQGVVSMDHPRYYNSGRGNLVHTMKDPRFYPDSAFPGTVQYFGAHVSSSILRVPQASYGCAHFHFYTARKRAGPLLLPPAVA